MENAKPMSVARVDFLNDLTELINNSHLPPFVVEPILKDIYEEVKSLSEKQYNIDYQNYMSNKKERSDDNV